jgi:hypothetical protein
MNNSMEMPMIAEPGNYKNAVKLMDELCRAGIECGETHGGVRIYPEDEYQRNDAQVICGKLGIHVHEGEQSFAVDFRDAMREERKC